MYINYIQQRVGHLKIPEIQLKNKYFVTWVNPSYSNIILNQRISRCLSHYILSPTFRLYYSKLHQQTVRIKPQITNPITPIQWHPFTIQSQPGMHITPRIKRGTAPHQFRLMVGRITCPHTHLNLQPRLILAHPRVQKITPSSTAWMTTTTQPMKYSML